MADFSWVAVSPAAQTLTVGRHGVESGPAGVTIVESRDFELMQVMARRGQWQAVAAAAEAAFAAPPPAQPKTVHAKSAILIWSGPDQFFALAPRGGEGTVLAKAREAFQGMASISEQSDGRVLLKLSGPKVRDAFAKFCSLDLDPSAFSIGAAASTSIDHTSVTLWRGADAAGETPVFFLLVFSTFSESLVRTILDGAAEYGVEVGAARAFDVSGV